VNKEETAAGAILPRRNWL